MKNRVALPNRIWSVWAFRLRSFFIFSPNVATACEDETDAHVPVTNIDLKIGG